MLRVHPSRIIRIGSTVPILLVLSIILMECYLYWTAYLLSNCFSESSASRTFHAVIFHSFLLLVMLCYVRVAVTGYVNTALLNKFSDTLPSAMENDEGDPHHLTKLPICRKCNQPKPLRTHHCSFCNKCVLKMDHHCPWVANCIGLCNYKFFLQFITYALIAIFMLMEKLCTRFERSVWSLQRSRHITDAMELSAFEFMAYVVAIAIGCSVLLLFITHLYLIIYGFTTIECHSIMSHSRYSRGWKHNLSDVFGDRIFDWIFPTENTLLESDFIVSAIHSDRWNAVQHSDDLTDEEHSLL